MNLLFSFYSFLKQIKRAFLEFIISTNVNKFHLLSLGQAFTIVTKVLPTSKAHVIQKIS